MKLINKFIFIFFSLFIVSYIIYVRLLMVRLPKDLICTERNFPYYLFSFCVLLFIFLLRIYLYVLSEVPKEVSAHSWSQKIKDKLQFDHYDAYYYAQLKKCHAYLIDNIAYMDDILNFLFNLTLKNYLNLRIMYFGLTYGPR
jgi:hypothetical protein